MEYSKQGFLSTRLGAVALYCGLAGLIGLGSLAVALAMRAH